MKEQVASRSVYENPEVEFIDVKLERVVTASCVSDIEKPKICPPEEIDDV